MKVSTPLNPELSQGASTIRGAVELVSRSERFGRARAESAAWRGATIVSTSWDDQCLAFYLAPSAGVAPTGYLQMFLTKNGVVDWAFTKATDKKNVAGSNDVQLVQMEFAHGVYEWNRGGILFERVGRKFLGISADRASIYLYVDGVANILVMVLQDLERSSPFLYWDLAG
jgi:hypothetical protein